MKQIDPSHPGFGRRSLVGSLACGAALLLAGRTAAAAQATEPLRLAASTGPLSLLIYVAQDKGYFEAESVAVRLDDCLGGNRCLDRVFERSADLATSSELSVVFSAFERSDHTIITTIASAANTQKLVGGKHVQRLGDLRGRRVGVVPRSGTQYFLDLSLLAGGIDPRTLQIVEVKPEETVDALREGRIEAAAIWEPYASLSLQALKGEGTLLRNEVAYTTTFNLIARRSALEARGAEFARLLRALARAEKFVAEQPRESHEILRRRLQLEPPLIDQMMRGTVYRLTLHQSLLATMESEVRWAIREGHVKNTQRPNLLQWVDTTALQAAKPSAVGIAR